MRLECIAFAGGAWWVQQQATLLDRRDCAIGVAAAALCCVIERIVHRRRAMRRALEGATDAKPRSSSMRVVAAFVIGVAWASWRADVRLSDALPAAWEGRDVVVTGTIASLPALVDRGVRFAFAVESYEASRSMPASPGSPCASSRPSPSSAMTGCDAPVHVPSSIALGWYSHAQGPGAMPRVRPGQRWRLSVRLKRPHGTANPDGFDYEYWLLEDGTRATGYVRDASIDDSGGSNRVDVDASDLGDDGSRRVARSTPRLVDPFVWSFDASIERARASLRDRIFDALTRAPSEQPAPYAGVLVALVVGDQRAIAQDDWTVFNRTGIGHLVSISGLHVSMLAALGAWCTFVIWRRRAHWAVVVPAHKAAAITGTTVALLYCLLAGFGVPAQRTLYMIATVAIALWMHRLTSPSRVLAIALAVVVVLDPWAVMGAGFWLSFVAVASIFFVTSGRLDMLADRSSRRARWTHAVTTAARVQWAVTLALTPLTLLFFHQVSIVSPLANAIAIPLVSFIVTPLALGGAIVPSPLSRWTLELAHALLALLVRFLETLSTSSFAVWSGPTPQPWVFVVAMIGVAWMLAPRGLPSRWAGALWLVPLFAWPPDRPTSHAFRMTALDVGQGTAVLIETRSHAVLYDTGPQYGASSDAGSRIVVPFLASRGIARLDLMVVSHNDLDHSGGASSIGAAIRVDQVASSLLPTSPIVRAAREHRPCAAGQRWAFDGVTFSFLHPVSEAASQDAAVKPNARSCVMRIEAGGRSALLTGDIERNEEQALVDRSGDGLATDVLVVPHHGSRTSSTSALLDATRPSWAIVQAGYLNRFGHPRPQVLARYADHGIGVVRTDRDGAIRVDVDQRSVTVERHRSAHARYWYGR